MMSVRKKVALGLATAAFVGAVAPSASIANAPPPTNGGNGGGHSGQCTGNPDDRPASCGP